MCCAAFTTCVLERHNTQVDDVQDYDVVLLMYNLLEINISEHDVVYANISGMSEWSKWFWIFQI